ncbi:hypothetical protein [Glutamicibacter sp. NPDC087344]|uniref:hypothetical protein n=1 Tax=Glutamicibacter sp. NPDC087344 TaxID=3363994 RepID=UPI0038297EAE
MNEPLKFRKKPEVVEAVQVLPENVELLRNWMPQGASIHIKGNEDLWIEWRTILGPTRVPSGDWVLRSESGFFETMKPLPFEARYERDVSVAQLTHVEQFGEDNE